MTFRYNRVRLSRIDARAGRKPNLAQPAQIHQSGSTALTLAASGTTRFPPGMKACKMSVQLFRGTGMAVLFEAFLALIRYI
jgi:hypothetical protein